MSDSKLGKIRIPMVVDIEEGLPILETKEGYLRNDLLKKVCVVREASHIDIHFAEKEGRRVFVEVKEK